MDSNEASITSLSIKGLKDDYKKWKQLAEDSTKLTDSEAWDTKIEGFDESTAKALTRVFTQWLNEVREVSDQNRKYNAYKDGISAAKIIPKFFGDLHSKLSPKGSTFYDYRTLLNMTENDIANLVPPLESFQRPVEKFKPRIPWVSNDFHRKSRVRQQVDSETPGQTREQLRSQAPANLGLLKFHFDELLNVCKEFDKESYAKLMELKKVPGKTPEYGNELLKNIIEKWEKERREYQHKPITPKTMDYRVLKDEELFIRFPLLHARKHGSYQFVGQLLSHIKHTPIGKQDTVNKGNIDTSSDVFINSDLFYDVIIPQVMLAYMHDDDFFEADNFLHFTRKSSYHLYDDEVGQKYWPDKYVHYLDHIEKSMDPECSSHGDLPPVPISRMFFNLEWKFNNMHGWKYGVYSKKPTLTLKQAQSDYEKQSELVTRLQSEDGELKADDSALNSGRNIARVDE
ncbi:hypothetical protein IWQ62_003345 [Dispira parvispora]|uniref:Uncharacterized protein n=1 Tax=Dispira parvispora TaxID=1520584 RepID=A0A9W8APJ7_9FUNG|nr:hypothetical protein IWQ62_003345 [Dispira parvispora]